MRKRVLSATLVAALCIAVYLWYPSFRYPLGCFKIQGMSMISPTWIVDEIFYVGSRPDWDRAEVRDTKLSCIYQGWRSNSREVVCGGLRTGIMPGSIAAHDDMIVLSGINGEDSSVGYDLFLYSRSAEVPLPLLRQPGDDVDPDIRNGVIAFENDGTIWYGPVAGSTSEMKTIPMVGKTPRISPDGKSICFTGVTPVGAGSREDIYVYSIDDHSLRKVTTGGRINRYPDWSPDGSHLCFTSDRLMPLGGGIWVVSADGKKYHPITRILKGDQSQVRWSGSGRYLVFTDTDYRDGSTYEHRLCQIDLRKDVWSKVNFESIVSAFLGPFHVSN